MEDLSVLEWAVGGAITIAFGAIGYLNSRIVHIERQILDLVGSLRRDQERSFSDVWTARDRDRDQREKDQEALLAFRQYVLTHLATKEDISQLETRVSGTVRMVMNEKMRKGDL